MIGLCRENDANPESLQGETVAIVGYGIQCQVGQRAVGLQP
jgi:ketol-acid reductoisomerase